jgi:hypothetical protein
LTITLKAGTRPIQLGTVTDLQFNRVERDGSVDIPLARGASRQGLGSQSAFISLAGTFVGDSRFDYFQQFDRIRMIGRSLKLEGNHLATIAYLNSVSLGKVVGDFLGYNLTLKESLFRQISSCDDLVGWGSDGSLSNEYDSPEPKEGDNYLKATKTGTSIYAVFEADDPIDLVNSEYVAFWIQTSNISVLSQAYLTLYGVIGDTTAYFHSKLLLPNVWYRILLHKSEFSNYLSFDFSQVTDFFVALAFNSNQNVTLNFDDLGVYE